MSDQAIETEVINIGAVGTASRPMFRVPTASGGITILGVYVTCGAAATVVSQLTNLGTSLGTAVSSVIGTLTAGTFTANVQKAYSITTAYQAAGTWIGFNGITGITDTVTMVVVEYKYGK